LNVRGHDAYVIVVCRPRTRWSIECTSSRDELMLVDRTQHGLVLTIAFLRLGGQPAGITVRWPSSWNVARVTRFRHPATACSRVAA
jgi:hypothetical protein